VTSTPCYSFTAPTIVDPLEAGTSAGNPDGECASTGYLGSRFPIKGSIQKLYAQKHNPFV
jgi:hypothetical protein